MARKTVDIDLLVQACNSALAAEDADISRTGNGYDVDPQSYRQGICAVAEWALNAANAYKGFMYQESELGSDGTLRVGYDATRRIYSVPYVRVRETE